MGSFYLMTFVLPGGGLKLDCCMASDQAHALEVARDRLADTSEYPEGTVIADVALREEPVWQIVGTPSGGVQMDDGRVLFSKRNHFLDGGTLDCAYRGRLYQATCDLSPEGVALARKLDPDPDAGVIGVAKISCDGGIHETIFALDSVDEQHAVDHLDGRIILFDGEIDQAVLRQNPEAAASTKSRVQS